MKNLTKRLTAFLAAAVMTVSATGISAFADNSTNESGLKNIWMKSEEGGYWQYLLSDGTAASRSPRKINGIVYDFSYPGTCLGKYSGMVKEKGVPRRYQDGLPYTGWTKGKDGSRKYYLDGYSVAGDLPIGKKVYSFDKNGIYTESKKAVLTAAVAGTITTDTDKLAVTISTTDKSGKEYAAGNPYKMERWEKGKWVDCKGNDEIYGINDVALLFSYGKSNTGTFYPQDYTGKNFTEGYYRIALSCWEDGRYDATEQEVYAVFEVLPPVSVDLRGDYSIPDGTFDVKFTTDVIIYSEKLQEYYSQHTDEIGLNIMLNGKGGWKEVKFDDSETTILLEVYENGEPVKPMKIYLQNAVPDVSEAGHYRSVVTVDGKEYKKDFLINKLHSESWLDEYYLKDDRLTAYFTLFNDTEKDMKIYPYVYDILEKKNDVWSWINKPDDAEFEPSGEKIILKAGEKIALQYNIYENYDVSELKAGTYAAYIGGWGYAEFKLTNKKPDTSKMPYANLSLDNIKNVKITHEYWEKKISADFTGNEARNIVSMLRQIVITGDDTEGFGNVEGGSELKVKITYGDGKTKTVTIIDAADTVLEYNGEYFWCGRNPYRALNDLLIEKSGIDKNYYGYRHS